jgi:queuosine precursor transporter
MVKSAIEIRVILGGIMKYIYLIGFIGTIFLANWLIKNVGLFCDPVCVIPVWPSIYAPSGVLAIGLGFTLRDLVQRYLGVNWTLIGIGIGALISAFIDPYLGIASGTAFLLSELLDLFVYTPLQERNLTLAVLASNLVGLVVDSIVFLYLAGIPMEFLTGQIIGKLEMTLLVLPIIWLFRHRKDQITIAYSNF